MEVPTKMSIEHHLKVDIVFKQAKDVKLWALEARRNLVLTLLDCWVEKCEEDATVEVISLFHRLTILSTFFLLRFS